MEIHTHPVPMERPPIPSRRIWLDATQESSGGSGTSSDVERNTTPPPPIPAVPVPAIPPEHAAAVQTPNIKRKSAPPGRVRTRVDNAAASPQVISSLLDSFTTVGLPDTAPHGRASNRLSGAKSSPATPVLRQRASFQGGQVQGSGSERTSLTDYELYRQQLADELEEPEAAEPPVIRTSKRPSGKSEWTAPKVSHESSLGSYVRSFRRSASSLSLQRGAGDDDTRSIGNASIDSTVRRRSLVSVSRESLDFRLSKKKSHSRIKSPTKEEFGPAEHDSVRELVLNATGAPDHLTPPTSPRRIRNAPFDETIQEQEEEPSPPLPAEAGESVREGKKPVLPPVDPVVGPQVPNRRSSLRHTDVPGAGRERHSRDVSVLQYQIEDALKEEEGIASTVEPDAVIKDEEPQTKVILSSLDGEPTEVTKRIRDLKLRKEQRDREARSSLTPEPEFGAQQTRSRSTSPLANSVTRAASGGEGKREDKAAEKKSRIAQLGAINVPPRGGHSGTTQSTPVQNGTAAALEAPQPQPTTPITPTQLPINYQYVVQSLSTKESAPSISGAASTSNISAVSTTAATTTATTTTSTTTTTSKPASLRNERSKSLVIGGRSAISRATATKQLPDVPKLPTIDRISTSPEPVTNDAQSARSSIDTTSAGKPSRSNSLRLKTRRRWSHPEVLPTVERTSSMTKRHESLAVQPPNTRPEKILEERPSSADSIDLDVKKFINHPRLSQKIRHPTSGRTIAFSEVGDPNGHAVFCCVGMGLTRYVTAFYDELAVTLGLRLITPDRPGVGGSPADPGALPLNWPDDILAICQALRISKFSIMAHSAGAIYALATALRMPQHIRGRVHLLAPWIPPSQMAPIGLTKQDPPPAAQLPKSQRFLRAMPTPFLKIANTGFLSAASASLSPNATPRRERRRRSDKFGSTKRDQEKENAAEIGRSDSKTEDGAGRPRPSHVRRESIMLMDQQDMPDGSALEYAKSTRDLRSAYGTPADAPAVAGGPALSQQDLLRLEEEAERREIYDSRLTLSIWALATTNANPAVDLLVCLERQRDIGFMYKDITRSVVIHHGSKDTRVPVENVKWLGRTMRKCEVRVLEGEGHGLMASAAVMGGVLEEMGREWREYDSVIKRTGGRGR